MFLVSGRSGASLMQDALAAGVSEVLTKPLESREIATTLARVLHCMTSSRQAQRSSAGWLPWRAAAVTSVTFARQFAAGWQPLVLSLEHHKRSHWIDW